MSYVVKSKGMRCSDWKAVYQRKMMWESSVSKSMIVLSDLQKSVEVSSIRKKVNLNNIVFGFMLGRSATDVYV